MLCRRVTGLLTEDGAVRGAETERGTLFADAVILATGGVSYPATGSTGDGHRFAAEAGHTVTPLRGSLVPLQEAGNVCAELQGLSLRNVGLTVFENGKKIHTDFGELLFTHFGVSGPLVLSASAHMIVEGDNKPMDELGGSGEPSEVDLAVARLVMEEIPSGACLQLGIGSMPGHKGLYGPQGTGVLLCCEKAETSPLMEGGTGSVSIQQEMPEFLPDRLEAGTHNVPGIAGLLEGVRFVREMGEEAICVHVWLREAASGTASPRGTGAVPTGLLRTVPHPAPPLRAARPVYPELRLHVSGYPALGRRGAGNALRPVCGKSVKKASLLRGKSGTGSGCGRECDFGLLAGTGRRGGPRLWKRTQVPRGIPGP